MPARVIKFQDFQKNALLKVFNDVKTSPHTPTIAGMTHEVDCLEQDINKGHRIRGEQYWVTNAEFDTLCSVLAIAEWLGESTLYYERRTVRHMLEMANQL